MKRLNKKGFTLVELLAVIVILGIIMLVAIPAVTGYITGTRKEGFLELAREVTSSISEKIANGEYVLDDNNTIYVFDWNNASMDQKPKSPFGGEIVDAYVYVTLDDEYAPTYYFTALDENGYYIAPNRSVDDLTAKDVKSTNMTSISGTMYVENKDNMIMINANGEEVPATEIENKTSEAEAKKCFDLEVLEDGTYSITDFYADDPNCYYNKGGSNTKSVNVPSLIDGKQVTKIGDSAFRNKGITEVILYKGITEVGYQAFMDNRTLTSIKMSSTVVAIDDYAFYQCGMERLLLSEGLETIRQFAFAYNHINYIYFPSTLKSIGQYAFYHNNLTEIEFHGNPSLGTAAFVGNQISESNKFIYKKNNDGSLDKTNIIGYAGSETTLVVPEGIKTIGPGAFASMGLTSVTLPSTLETISNTAFYNNSLQSVTFPSGLKSIGASAFRNNLLTSLTIPSSVTSIGGGAFKYNCVTSINGESSSILYAKAADGSWDYTTIVSGTNGACNLRSIVIPAQSHGVKLKRIMGGSFSEFSYTSITFPNIADCDHLTVDVNAFYHNRLPESEAYIYKISNGVIDYSTLDSYAGNPASDTGVIRIPATAGPSNTPLTTIRGTFGWKNFKTIIIPSTVTSMNNGILNKATTNNKNFQIVVNKTGRPFNWAKLTGSTYQTDETFITGELRHQSGNITITDTE